MERFDNYRPATARRPLRLAGTYLPEIRSSFRSVAAGQPDGVVNAMVRIDCIAKDTIAALRLALSSVHDGIITQAQFAAIVQGLLECACFAPFMPGFGSLESEDFRLYNVAIWLTSFPEQSTRGWSVQDVEGVLLAIKAEDDALMASYESD